MMVRVWLNCHAAANSHVTAIMREGNLVTITRLLLLKRCAYNRPAARRHTAWQRETVDKLQNDFSASDGTAVFDVQVSILGYWLRYCGSSGGRGRIDGCKTRRQAYENAIGITAEAVQEMTLVSIIVPCFNAEDFITDALASLQQQSFSDWECLVVDDCSTDGSADIIMQLAKSDARIKPLFQSVNGGASRARNRALDEASGQWVTLLDADDLFVRDRLEKLVTLAQQCDADMVFDNQIISEFPSTAQVGRAFHWLVADCMPYSPNQFFLQAARFGRSLNPGYMKPLFSRAFIEAHGLRYDPEFRSGQDFLFYANAFAANPVCFASGYAGYIYRRRKGSLSRSGGQHLRGHARLSDEILLRHGSAFSSPVRNALERRRRHFLGAAALYDLRLALASKSWMEAARIMTREPRILGAAAAAARRRLLISRAGA